ncbi:SURF1 family protein [Kinneretia asaccharophila]|uniref:SURF1-like protein n=1 Tax=Roseateles asaccharophilus TaxID=582607 RepID=A0A4R6MYI5_9BURK|nr:SURF1 family protein [Roseateles asaccharophilus]MDN3545766.1 SURF1 family protein [Roseateles asaccharophilus]TDP07634.1 surfeit locus 1 family protein [Roseateles asaccharophilus]
MRGRALILLATVLSLGLALRLGWWQLDRAAQKTALLQAQQAQAKRAPLSAVELVAAPPQAREQLQRRVRLRGHWLDAHTVYLENRPMAGRTGFYVITPLQLVGRNEAILVQRGWLPRDARDRERLPELPQQSAEVEIEGRLIEAPTRLYQLGEAGGGRIRQNLDAVAFAQEIRRPLLPLTVLQQGDALAGTDGLLRDWPAPDAGVQKHYGYAFQWFALGALILGLYVWFQLIRPRRRQAR